MKKSLTFWISGVMIFILSSFCSIGQEINKWDEYVNSYVEEYMRRNPDWAVKFGRLEFFGMLPDFSPEGVNKEIIWNETQYGLIQGFSNSDLTESQRIEKENLLRITEGNIFWMKQLRWPFRNAGYYTWRLDPSFYLSRGSLSLEERMAAFSRYLNSLAIAVQQIKTGYSTELPLPKAYLQIGKTVFGGFADFIKKDATEALKEVKNEELTAEFNDAKQNALGKLDDFYQWLDQQMPGATDDFALGEETFSKMLWVTDRINMTVAELKETAERDIDRNIKAIQNVCSKYYPGKSFEECIRMIQSVKPEKGLIETADEQLTLLKDFIETKHIVTIPEYTQITVEESPSYRRWNSASADLPGPYDKTLKGKYYISLPDPDWTEKERFDYIPCYSDLLFISVHEVWPGHFLNVLHYKNIRSLPAKLFKNYTTMEGWAHYTEEMMFEQGLGNGAPDIEIGMRLNSLLRDVRFLAAIVLHTEGASVKEVEEMFRKYAFLDNVGARQQALRGTFDPQYYGYTLGKLLIMKLRDAWMAEHPRGNNIQEFHDKFLSYGLIPVSMITEAMLKK